MPYQNILDAIKPLHTAEPNVPEAPSEKDVDLWRHRIDMLDSAILQLLNERSRCANIIGHIKKRIGMGVYVPSREAEVISNVLQHNNGPLPDVAVQHLFERIIDETRSLERKKYQENAGSSES